MASSAALLKSPLQCLRTAKQGSRAAVGRGSGGSCVATSSRVAQLRGGWLLLLRGGGCRGVGCPQGLRRGSHASSQAVCLMAWQPPTQTGTCNVRPGTFLRPIRKSKSCEGTLTYLHNQFGWIFYQYSSFKPIQYPIQTFWVLSFWVFFNTTDRY